jgi:hypothetical protein
MKPSSSTLKVFPSNSTVGIDSTLLLFVIVTG